MCHKATKVSLYNQCGQSRFLGQMVVRKGVRKKERKKGREINGSKDSNFGIPDVDAAVITLAVLLIH